MALSKSDKFYIDTHHGRAPNKEIAKAIGCKVEDITQYIESNKQKNQRIVKLDDFAIQHGTVSMTKAASEVGDDAEKQGRIHESPEQYLKRNEHMIHRPKGG